MANRRTSRRGFTLIELLIVVALVALLAAIIIGKYGTPTRDAKQSALEHAVHTMRSQIEVYKAHHLGDYPEIVGNDLPQLTRATDGQGRIGEAGPDYPYGLYLDDPLPANAMDGSNHVSPVARSGEKPVGAVGSLGGWQYDETTGAVWPNNPEYYKLEGAQAAAAQPSE